MPLPRGPGGQQTLRTFSEPTETFMERRADVRRRCSPTVKMAEAAVTPQHHRFFCHCCKCETKPKLPVRVRGDPPGRSARGGQGFCFPDGKLSFAPSAPPSADRLTL